MNGIYGVLHGSIYAMQLSIIKPQMTEIRRYKLILLKVFENVEQNRCFRC